MGSHLLGRVRRHRATAAVLVQMLLKLFFRAIKAGAEGFFNEVGIPASAAASGAGDAWG